MAEAENPTQIKDDDRTPEELIVFNEMSNAIKLAMKKLPSRERDLIEAKFFKDKKLRELSDDFDIEDSGLTPEQNELKKATMLAVREAIKELPERYGICLDMYFFYDMTYNEISEVVDLPVNTIKSHIFRAKKILKDKLQEMVTE
jgi:DNA-directed RNA polymerase specialized sigma24 family protein